MPRFIESPQSRPPLARMMVIHEQLQHGKRVNCSTIAELLEVSSKTAQRDIEFMRDQWGFPIEYDRSAHGYRYTQEVTEFPVLRVTEGEMVGLLVAQKALEQFRGTPFERTLETAFAKITSGLTDEISFNPSEITSGIAFQTLGTSKADIAIFRTISQAIRHRRELTIHYMKPLSSFPEERRVQPHLLANIQNLWYVVCFDPGKKGYRQFALPRIKSVQLSSIKFERKADFSADQFLAESFGAYSGKEDIEVIIRFDAFAATFIQERSWHPTEKLVMHANGALELSIHVPRLEEVTSWVLSWGAHATVVAPPEFIKRVRESARAILPNYQDH